MSCLTQFATRLCQLICRILHPPRVFMPRGAGNNGGEDERSVPDGDNEDSESEEEDDEEAI